MMPTPYNDVGRPELRVVDFVRIHSSYRQLEGLVTRVFLDVILYQSNDLDAAFLQVVFDRRCRDVIFDVSNITMRQQFDSSPRHFSARYFLANKSLTYVAPRSAS